MEIHQTVTEQPDQLQTAVHIPKSAIRTVRHGHFHPSVLYSHTKPGVNVAYPSAAVWLYYVVLQVTVLPTIRRSTTQHCFWKVCKLSNMCLKINMGHWWKDIDRGISKYWEQKLF
jgi:membrane protein YdbS with pleckstrin-like domain